MYSNWLSQLYSTTNRFKGPTCATPLPREVQQQEGETRSKYNTVSQSGRYNSVQIVGSDREYLFRIHVLNTISVSKDPQPHL